MENRRVTRNRTKLNYVKSNSESKYARQASTRMEKWKGEQGLGITERFSEDSTWRRWRVTTQTHRLGATQPDCATKHRRCLWHINCLPLRLYAVCGGVPQSWCFLLCFYFYACTGFVLLIRWSRFQPGIWWNRFGLIGSFWPYELKRIASPIKCILWWRTLSGRLSCCPVVLLSSLHLLVTLN